MLYNFNKDGIMYLVSNLIFFLNDIYYVFFVLVIVLYIGNVIIYNLKEKIIDMKMIFLLID